MIILTNQNKQIQTQNYIDQSMANLNQVNNSLSLANLIKNARTSNIYLPSSAIHKISSKQMLFVTFLVSLILSGIITIALQKPLTVLAQSFFLL
jgi:hypothetical protein